MASSGTAAQMPSAWTQQEDELLRSAVCEFGCKNWIIISSDIVSRSDEECKGRWKQLQAGNRLIKKPWKPSEDSCILDHVSAHGSQKWWLVASYLQDRTNKQCRERWHNQLDPAIRRDAWVVEEDTLIADMQAKHGNCWARITKHLPGRTDNAIKNRWHALLKTRRERRARVVLQKRADAMQTSQTDALCSSPRVKPHGDFTATGVWATSLAILNDQHLADSVLVDLHNSDSLAMGGCPCESH